MATTEEILGNNDALDLDDDLDYDEDYDDTEALEEYARAIGMPEDEIEDILSIHDELMGY